MLSGDSKAAAGGMAAATRPLRRCSTSSSCGGGSAASSRSSSVRLLLLAVLGAALVSQASASLVAIDLGSEFLKVCLVKPGRTPISIVVNEMSKRKTPSLVGLVPDGSRVLGEEASSLNVRFPGSIYAQLRNFLGRSASDGESRRLLEAHRLPYKLVDHPGRGTAAVAVNATTAYLVEELVAGILQYARRITEAQAGETVIDAVITVPVWLGVAQRQAVLDAARLAGLNVLGLINSHAAAALQYGIERDFTKKEQTVILYEMGSGSTQAALVKYSAHGKSKASLTNQLEVLDVAWDHALGSNDLDVVLADHFAAEFKTKGGGDISASPKAQAKLRRQVRRTKEVLSANSNAPLSVEELHEGLDFSASISRAEFEGLAGDFWERAAAPLKTLLERNKLTPAQVDAVELLGGGSRVPKLQAVLSEALGGRHLDRHLDADEAVVLGAGLFAANMSSSFRLRKFGLTDHAAFGVSFESHDLFTPKKAAAAAADKKKADKADEAHDASSSTPGHVLKSLLPAGKKLPIKRAVKYANLTIDGFSFTLAYNGSGSHGLPPGVSNPLLATYTVAGISEAAKRYNTSGTLALRFEADYSGLVHFTTAECVIEQEITEDKIIEVPAPSANATANGTSAANTTAADGSIDAEKSDATATDGKEDTDSKDAADAEGADAAPAANATTSASNATSNATSTPEPPKMIKKTIQVTRRKTYNVALNVTGPGPSHPPLAGPLFDAASANITAWVVAEGVKAATAKAKNDLESYIISTREALETHEGLQAVTTEEARSSFTEALTDAEDWLYGDGEAEGADAFTARLAALRKVGDPMTGRAAEKEAREELLPALAEQVAAAEATIAAWAPDKPWIGDNETTKAADKVSEFKAWLAKQEAAQAKLAPTDAPAFAAADVAARWEGVQKAVSKTDKTPKPKPPAADKKAANATSADSNTTTTTADDAADGEDKAGGSSSSSDKAGGPDSKAGGKDAAVEDDNDEELPSHEEL